MERLKSLWPKNPRAALFRLIALGAVIFAAGHSGSFLNTQEGSLARYGWGVFGAVVAGLALWGGVYLYASRRDRLGLAVAIVAALADAAMSYGWFVMTGSFVPVILAIWPPLLAVLAGLIEGTMSRDIENHKAIEEEKDRQLQRDLELQRLKGQQRLDMRRLALGVQTPAPQVRYAVQAKFTEPKKTPTDAEMAAILAGMKLVSVRGASEASGMSIGWTHDWMHKHGWASTSTGWVHSNGKERENDTERDGLRSGPQAASGQASLSSREDD